MTTETRDQLEARRVRLVHDLGRARRGEWTSYEGLRKLENAIREHADGGCDCSTPAECLRRLAQRVPAKPRRTMRELRARSGGPR